MTTLTITIPEWALWALVIATLVGCVTSAISSTLRIMQIRLERKR